MITKGLVDEDFVQYKKPSMTIMFHSCDFKCGEIVCQNSALAASPNIFISVEDIVSRYMDNKITHSIVLGGLEPMDDWLNVLLIVKLFRQYTHDDIVIYTGYNKNEIIERITELKKYANIIIKFGRYIPGQQKHYDDVLGVFLASDNQYAEKIS